MPYGKFTVKAKERGIMDIKCSRAQTFKCYSEDDRDRKVRIHRKVFPNPPIETLTNLNIPKQRNTPKNLSKIRSSQIKKFYE